MPTHKCSRTLETGDTRQRIEATQDVKIASLLVTIATITSKPLHKRSYNDKIKLKNARACLNKEREKKALSLIEHDKSDWVFIPANFKK